MSHGILNLHNMDIAFIMMMVARVAGPMVGGREYLNVVERWFMILEATEDMRTQ